MLDEGIPSDSFLAEANTVYKKANDLLCSAECPCALRGDVTDGRQLTQHDSRHLKLVKDAKGPTSVPKCVTFESRVYGSDEDKAWQFSELLAELED